LGGPYHRQMSQIPWGMPEASPLPAKKYISRNFKSFMVSQFDRPVTQFCENFAGDHFVGK